MFFKQLGNQPRCNSTKSTYIGKIFYCQENVALFTWEKLFSCKQLLQLAGEEILKKESLK